MTTIKKRVLPVFSIALVSTAALAVLLDAASAGQQPPVRYGTDPGYVDQAPQQLSYTDEADTGPIEHIVEPRQTVYALGRLYDVSPSAIIEENGLIAPYELRVGQLVMIPVPYQETLEPVAQQASARVEDYQPLPTPMTQTQSYAMDTVYEVRQGDTMYNISRRFDISVADLAAANNISEPYTISLHQKLVIPGAAINNQPYPQQRMAAAPMSAPAPVLSRSDQAALSAKVLEETASPQALPELGAGSPFSWPVRGPVLADFGDQQAGGARSDGINIAAPIGAPVRATADGEVVYRGNELDGYGNLLLVKHEDGWVSAYAHNDAILVRKGDFVRQGQVIAKVGRSGNVERPQLHFQLRKNLQPQDPIIAMQGELEGAAMTAASLP